jgi:uncharacterized glyoxalase superfamily protein PhnB
MMMQARRQTVFAAPRYDDAWAAIAFLELCFGFERQTVHEDPNGKVAHAELRLGTASFGLSSANGPVTSDNPWTSVRSGVYVALQDANAVDAHHAHAKAAGAVIAMPLEDTDYARVSTRSGTATTVCCASARITMRRSASQRCSWSCAIRTDRPRLAGSRTRLASSPRSRAALPTGRPSARNFVSATVPCG